MNRRINSVGQVFRASKAASFACWKVFLSTCRYRYLAHPQYYGRWLLINIKSSLKLRQKSSNTAFRWDWARNETWAGKWTHDGVSSFVWEDSSAMDFDWLRRPLMLRWVSSLEAYWVYSVEIQHFIVSQPLDETLWNVANMLPLLKEIDCTLFRIFPTIFKGFCQNFRAYFLKWHFPQERLDEFHWNLATSFT